MAKLKDCNGLYRHWCPACERPHHINTEAGYGPVWDFDGNIESPTFSPSVRVQYNGPDADTREEDGHRNPSACCHYFVRAGHIEFCGDSSHGMAGQTVPLPNIPANWD